MNNYSKIGFVLTSVIALMSCKKDKISSVSVYSKAKITVSIKCDNTTVYFDSIMNTNSSGNLYSVNTLNFYISGIKLKQGEQTLYASNKVIYIDPSINSKSSFFLDSVPSGNYTEIQYKIGVDAAQNKDYHLESTMDNLNMAWPTAMGGGYHFLKMEGHYFDTAQVLHGYAIHIGRNENIIDVKHNQLLRQVNNAPEYALVFNINEVFTNPYPYNLNIETNYTMSDSMAMVKIKNNIKDAFVIIQNK